jgi:signal transduction histidine kinase
VNARQRILGRRSIVVRLVVAVAAAMVVILVLALGFVYWRVSYALNRQLDQDLKAWRAVVAGDVRAGNTPPSHLPGLTYQIYDLNGRLIDGPPDIVKLTDKDDVVATANGDRTRRYDLGSLIRPVKGHDYRVQLESVNSPSGRVVVASAISRNKHDEALRELQLQLTIAGLLTLMGASLVGYRTARAALNPVESYRRAAQQAGAERVGRLPVAEDRDDELTRLGHTFNDLLEDIEAGAARERQFLADASHELRTPLTLMSTELEWARHRRRSVEELEGVLDSMQQQVTRLVELSDTLLDVEELRAATDITREPVSLRDLVDDAIRDAQPVGSEVQVDVPHVEVMLNRRWLTIALANLLRNAVRHGRPPITVRASVAAGQVRLVVSDDGPGFPSDFRETAFDRFSRADKSRTTPGSGLGLHLVDVIAKAHRGRARILDTETGAAVEISVAAPAPAPFVA